MNESVSTYRLTFPSRHVVLPVIHVDTKKQALRNVAIARDAGANGVFLINHVIGDEALLEIHEAVVEAHADWWVGVNCLGLSPQNVFEVVSDKVRGIWVDNAGIEEPLMTQPEAELVRQTQQARVPGCLYFGGVAFKYQRRVEDLESVSRIASRFMDVVTTSGDGTGQAAHVEKIRRMKSTIGDTPLGIASGITPENVDDYMPHADCFLVATGISQTFTELDPVRVRALVQKVAAFSG